MIGYKLFRKRKDGSYGPLFINCKQRLEIGVEYRAESHYKKGYAWRPGWHICRAPVAPHLKMKPDRVWCKVHFVILDKIVRPENQGGVWYLGARMTILEELK